LFTWLALISWSATAKNIDIEKKPKTEQSKALKISYDVNQINKELKEELIRINDLIGKLLKENNQIETEIQLSLTTMSKAIKFKIEDLQVTVLEFLDLKKLIGGLPNKWIKDLPNTSEKINNIHQEILKSLKALEETYRSKE